MELFNKGAVKMIPIVQVLNGVRVIPIVRHHDTNVAMWQCQALVEGGFPVIEIALTTPNPDRLFRHFIQRYPGVTWAAGTVLTRDMAAIALDAGARLVISPDYSQEVAHYAAEHDVPYIPGVMTPSEISRALREGLTVLKLFPAGTVGEGHLKAVQKVFPAVRFIPTGGIGAEDVDSWLACGALAVGLGGKLLQGTAAEITERSRRLLQGGRL